MSNDKNSLALSRRTLLRAAGAASVPFFGHAPAFAQADRPVVSHGVMSGDVLPGRAMVWSRADRPSRMMVSYKVGNETRKVVGPHCLDITDYTGRIELTGLPAGAVIEYEVTFQGLTNARAISEPVKGRLKTPPGDGVDVRFLWGGDTCGQGWGINPDFGGMICYEAMRLRRPDFFIHSGDNIYADGPILAEVNLPGGGKWRNIVTEEKSKVAETLNEFRGNYRYNLLDDNLKRFNSEVAQIWQWDDHEVSNNWSPSKDITADSRYTEKNVPLLVARAAKAFLEYAPMRFSSEEGERVYRKIPYGPLVDVFVLDMRTYRGPNTFNRQENPSDETVYLGAAQLAWLKQSLKESKAVWKVIAADMPIGLNVGDGLDAQGRDKFEAIANGNGPALGRELEIADLLRYIKYNNIKNTVWFTADVHYCAAHYYDPAQARFNDFAPFWEFVAGPLNAGTFGPNSKDDTFGIQTVFEKAPPPGQVNLPPSAGYQFFGEVNVSSQTQQMTVSLRDIRGVAVFTRVLDAI